MRWQRFCVRDSCNYGFKIYNEDSLHNQRRAPKTIGSNFQTSLLLTQNPAFTIGIKIPKNAQNTNLCQCPIASLAVEKAVDHQA